MSVNMHIIKQQIYTYADFSSPSSLKWLSFINTSQSEAFTDETANITIKKQSQILLWLSEFI